MTSFFGLLFIFVWFCNFLGELDEDAFIKVVHVAANFENDDEESVGDSLVTADILTSA